MTTSDLTNQQQKTLARIAAMMQHHTEYKWFSLNLYAELSASDLNKFCDEIRKGATVKYALKKDLLDYSSVLLDMYRLEDPRFFCLSMSSIKACKKSSL